MSATTSGGYFPWAATHLDDSPRGPTWCVRRESELLCYTKDGWQGEEDAQLIAGVLNNHESAHDIIDALGIEAAENRHTLCLSDRLAMVLAVNSASPTGGAER